MNTSFVLSLKHISCAKIITLLLKDPDLILKSDVTEEEHYGNKSKLIDTISKLKLNDLLKKELENFITPILREGEHWVEICARSWLGLTKNNKPLSVVIRNCFLSDGSIDREKAAKMWIKQRDANPLNRLVYACIYGTTDEIMDVWNSLLQIEIAFLRNRYMHSTNSEDDIVRRWMAWLDSGSTEDWKASTVETLESCKLRNNVYALKQVIQTFSPVEKNRYLSKTLLEGTVNNDVVKFGLQELPRERREVIFRRSRYKVFKCFLSWPLRSIFFDLIDSLGPYETSGTFCCMLKVILNKIKDEGRDYVDYIFILKNFYAQCPAHLKKAADQKWISRPLDFVLKYDFANQFSRHQFCQLFPEELR